MRKELAAVKATIREERQAAAAMFKGRFAGKGGVLPSEGIGEGKAGAGTEAHKVKVPIHLNMAACQIQLGDCNTAVYNCSQVGTLVLLQCISVTSICSWLHFLRWSAPCSSLALQALQMDPGNAKALYRRARARHLLGQTEGALEDLEAALSKWVP